MKPQNPSHLQPVATGSYCHNPARLASGSFADTNVRAVDVWEIARRAPTLWARFLREAYHGDLAGIMMSFGVCERTARRWLAGEGGTRGQHHIVAQQEHPEVYRRIVLARAA